MSKKDSFAKLTEDLEKIENIEKSVEEVEVIEPQEEEVVEKGTDCSDCGKPKADCSCKVEKADKAEEEDKKKVKDREKKVEKSDEEEDKKDKKKVEKSDDDDEDKDDDKDSDDDDDKDDDKNKDKKPVKKSVEEPIVEAVEEAVEAVSEQDFLGAFEAVVKSYGGLLEKHNLVVTELAEIKKSMGEVLEFISKANFSVSLGEEIQVGEPKPEPVAEEQVEKSIEKPEEELEGKAVEYVAKSVDGIPVVEGAEAEVEEEPVFNAMEHVSTITNYFMKNTSKLSEGEKYGLRGAVNRVKRGEGTTNDVDLFRQIVEMAEN